MKPPKLIIPDAMRPIELEREEFDLFFQEKIGHCDKCGCDFGGQPTQLMFGAKRKTSGRIEDEEATILVCKNCWTNVFGELPECKKGRILEDAVEIDGFRYDANDFDWHHQGRPHFHVGERLIVSGQRENKPGRDVTYTQTCGVCGRVLFEVEYAYATRNKDESNPLNPKICKDCWSVGFCDYEAKIQKQKENDRDEAKRQKEIDEKIINTAGFVFFGLPIILDYLLRFAALLICFWLFIRWLIP